MPGTDAGPPGTDGGVGFDSGNPSDSGSGMDAGLSAPDAGGPEDRGTTDDGGPPEDGGTTDDGGAPKDGGTTDAGGPPVDGGTTDDGGPPEDGGTHEDAGTASMDAGPPPPCFLTASPSSVTFSGVSLGMTSTQSVTVTNAGTETCDIVATAVDPVNGGPTSNFTVTLVNSSAPGVVSVAPGGTTTLHIGFTPTTSSSEQVTAEVDYYDDAAGNINCELCNLEGGCSAVCQQLLIPVSAGTLSPQVCVTPSSLAFGSVAVGQTKELSFTISDCGQGTLTVRGVRIDVGFLPGLHDTRRAFRFR